eukprot:scaffold4280_cov385-Prasinococcus_capsulatus_cf.AAC.2
MALAEQPSQPLCPQGLLAQQWGNAGPAARPIVVALDELITAYNLPIRSTLARQLHMATGAYRRKMSRRLPHCHGTCTTTTPCSRWRTPRASGAQLPARSSCVCGKLRPATACEASDVARKHNGRKHGP